MKFSHASRTGQPHRSVRGVGLAELIRWGGYGFVVFDTLARCMVGGDENTAKDCGLVVDVLNRLRNASGRAGLSSRSITPARTARRFVDPRPLRPAPTLSTRRHDGGTDAEPGEA